MSWRLRTTSCRLLQGLLHHEQERGRETETHCAQGWEAACPMQGCLGAQGRLCQGIISAWSGLAQRLDSPHTQLIHNFPLHILATVFRLA